jgi:UDP-glucose 4-epimerase
MEKVVVIGGSGFVGSHTADELSMRGYEVVIYDRKKPSQLQDGQSFVIGDLLDYTAVVECVTGAKILYHFGGIADIDEARSRPFDTISANVMGTATVLKAAQMASVERLLFASTMYVYSPFGSFYRATKQASEILIEAYSEEYGIDFTFLRFGSLYGPRAQDWNGLRRYIEEVVRTGKLQYAGTGDERREYIHVKDAARLSVDVLDSQYKNRAVTVTGSQVLRSTDLIDMIFEIAGVPKEVNFLPTGRKQYHYTTTPYRYTPKKSQKIVPEGFIDIGEGILEIVEEIHEENEDS